MWTESTTAIPRPARSAKRFDEVKFSDALSIAGKVVQQKAIAFGKKTGVRFEVAALGENYATTVGSHRSTLGGKEPFAGSAQSRAARSGVRLGWEYSRSYGNIPHLFEVTGIAVRTPDLARRSRAGIIS